VGGGATVRFAPVVLRAKTGREGDVTVSVHKTVYCLQSTWEQSSDFEEPRTAQSVSLNNEHATVVWFSAEERHFFSSEALRPAGAHPVSYSLRIKWFFLRH
jgi:hypothetical protein